MAIFGIERGTLAFLSLDDSATAIKTAMGTGAVGQHGFTAIRARAPLRFSQAIVSPPLVLDSFRSSSLRYRHGFSPIFLRADAVRSMSGLDCDLTTDFESAENGHSRIAALDGTIASVSIEVRTALLAQAAALLAAERPRRQS